MSPPRSPLPTSHSSLRRLAELLLLLVIAVLAMRAWFVEGLVLPWRVSSGSMAESLLGLHRELTCAECEYPFVCGADFRRVSPLAVCPNCGCPKNDLSARPDLAGDGLLVHKSLFRLRPPRRWEVVAFRHPQLSGELQIKRAVGLPGESVQIRHGDVYIDGKIHRKTLSQQRTMAILVHDVNYQPLVNPAPPPRWQGAGTDSQWGSSGRDFAHPDTDDRTAIDWLEYRHWSRIPSGGDDDVKQVEVLEGPITDVCGYNQSRPRRQENVWPVTDLMLSLKLVDTLGEGKLILRISDGSEDFQVWIEPSRRRFEILQNGRPIPFDVGKLPRWRNELAIDISLFDQQFLMAFDREVAVTYRYRPSNPDRQPTSRPLAIGSQGLQVRLRDFRVYRDVYYTRPVGADGRWALDQPQPLKAGEYFVLGDNSPISLDSRTWPEGAAVPAMLLVGKPLLVHFPVHRVEWGDWIFQVPDPRKIRYIR